jgi:hypothetical protein
MAKFFHKMSFWGFIGYIVTPFVVVGEGTILALDLHPFYHSVVIAAVIVSGYIKYYIKDENNNGIVDKWEPKKSKKPLAPPKDDSDK